MRRRRLLETSIFLALNIAAHGQWHTNEPYVAWPATNHLRWMTNVIVATNETDWQGTNGFAAWTNNYLWDTNVWAGKTSVSDDDDFGYQRLIFAPYKFRTYNAFFPVGFAYETNAFLQAKDTRAFDCERALMERWFVLGTNNTITNYYTFAQGSLPGGYKMGSSYKDEAVALYRCKSVAKKLLPYYYLQTSNEFPVVCTESSVCTRANVPTNFMAAYIYRAPDGMWTPYANIMTSTWTLATSSAGIVTNVTVDSWSNPVTLIGTNGQQFSKIITNTAILPGKRAEDYGWDAMRAVITNLTMTARDGAWGIGYGSNTVSENYLTNFTKTVEAYVSPIAGVTNGETVDQVELRIRTTNGWAAGDSGYAEPFEPFPWTWYWTNQPAYLCQTGQAPSAVFSASYTYYVWQRFEYRFISSLLYANPDEPWLNTTFYWKAYATHTNSWKAYNAPIAMPLDSRYGRTLDAWITSNSVKVLWEQTNIAAGASAYTSAVYEFTVPSIPSTFGSSNVAPAVFSSEVGTDPPDGGAVFYDQTSSSSSSTNNAYPTIGASKVFEKWEFQFR